MCGCCCGYLKCWKTVETLDAIKTRFFRVHWIERFPIKHSGAPLRRLWGFSQGILHRRTNPYSRLQNDKMKIIKHRIIIDVYRYFYIVCQIITFD